MLRSLCSAALALAALAVPAAASAQTGGYDIKNQYSGDEIDGTAIGTHTLPVNAGTFGQTNVTGGNSPVVIATGQIAAGTQTYLRMHASYRYNISIAAIDTPSLLALQNVIIVSSDRSGVVGTLSGIFKMSGSANSDSEVQLGASSEYGSTSFFAGCDSGYCWGPGSVVAGADNPYSLTMHLAEFGWGCYGGGCGIGPSSVPFSTIQMDARAGVGYTNDSYGNSLGGNSYAMLDPAFTLDPSFFTANGLNPANYSAQISTANAGVPEPASWALMIAGVGVIGGLLRRRPQLALT